MDPPIMGHVAPERILDPAISELRKKKKLRLRELRAHDRLNSIVRARQYRAEYDHAQKNMHAFLVQDVEGQREEELRQVWSHMHGVRMGSNV